EHALAHLVAKAAGDEPLRIVGPEDGDVAPWSDDTEQLRKAGVATPSGVSPERRRGHRQVDRGIRQGQYVAEAGGHLDVLEPTTVDLLLEKCSHGRGRLDGIDSGSSRGAQHGQPSGPGPDVDHTRAVQRQPGEQVRVQRLAFGQAVVELWLVAVQEVPG